jgi:hypothetical protein
MKLKVMSAMNSTRENEMKGYMYCSMHLQYINLSLIQDKSMFFRSSHFSFISESYTVVDDVVEMYLEGCSRDCCMYSTVILKCVLKVV